MTAPEPRIDSWRVSATTSSPSTFRTEASGNEGFDELVVGRWFHLERMDTRIWWLGMGDKSWNIRIGRDGRPTVTDL
jgi:hypothetical protein